MQQPSFGRGEWPSRAQPNTGLFEVGLSDVGPSGSEPAIPSTTIPVPSPTSQSRPTFPCSGPAGPRNPKPMASITAPVSARHNQVRRAMIGCGAASVSAPPASGNPSAINCSPRVARKVSAPGTVLAASTSQARAEGSRMQEIMDLRTGACHRRIVTRRGFLAREENCTRNRGRHAGLKHSADVTIAWHLPKDVSDD